MKWSTWLLTAVVFTASCWSGIPEEEGISAPVQRLDASGNIVLSAAEREALGLELATVQPGTLTTARLRFGKVSARPQEDGLVVAPVTGRLGSPPVLLGAHVRKGDIVIVLQPLPDTASRANLEAQRRELQGKIEAAQAGILALESELKRISSLVSSQLATGAEMAHASSALKAEQARVTSLQRARTELTRMTGGQLELRAPFAGLAAELDSEQGLMVQQGTILARIVRPGPRWITLAVPPGDHPGTSYRVYGLSGPLPATLLSRGAVVEPDGTRHDRLEVDGDAAPDLPPGSTVPVDVLHESQGLLVPAMAVVRQGDESLLFVEILEGRYEPRRVDLGPRDTHRMIVLSGLSSGDRIVVRGAAALLGELGDGRRTASDRRAPA